MAGNGKKAGYEYDYDQEPEVSDAQAIQQSVSQAYRRGYAQGYHQALADHGLAGQQPAREMQPYRPEKAPHGHPGLTAFLWILIIVLIVLIVLLITKAGGKLAI